MVQVTPGILPSAPSMPVKFGVMTAAITAVPTQGSIRSFLAAL
ncbi:hypothetical protein [Streptomyces sp. NPDC048659]